MREGLLMGMRVRMWMRMCMLMLMVMGYEGFGHGETGI